MSKFAKCDVFPLRLVLRSTFCVEPACLFSNKNTHSETPPLPGMACAVLPSDTMLCELQHQILKTRRKLHKKKKSSAARGRLAAELATLEQELASYMAKQRERSGEPKRRQEPSHIVVLRLKGG
jgi:hypothetical protein